MEDEGLTCRLKRQKAIIKFKKGTLLIHEQKTNSGIGHPISQNKRNDRKVLKWHSGKTMTS